MPMLRAFPGMATTNMRPFLSLRSCVLLLACLGLLAAALSAPAAGQTAQTRAFIAHYAKAHDFNGSVLIQEQGRIDNEHGFGLANRPFQVLNTPQTRYRIASITKAFIAMLLLQLHEACKVDLHQTIGHYLPVYP